ncbi:MAG: hypothetical protein FWF31_01685, partial [Desulfobulbus sp.]|nr:hypothetical protein [Desulfobulbus sp.]
MKKSQHDHISSMDDFEDLTLFANESFDTGDVDLFEFTSEESSPLMRLKSTILSLDWEINDEILQELEDELGNLKSMWQEDKVAEVYLQGLSKIGSYIRTKGAYAHLNSIKLLLTFFYNFEKIISSTQITGEEITQLLKGDVRKFKILQYQINQSEMTAEEESHVAAGLDQASISAAPSGTITVQDACKQLKAAILSLDWEVTNESLRQFNERINAFHTLITNNNNKPAFILTQGLQALGDYIAEERADSHPESFILLHSFNDALNEFVKTGDEQLGQDALQDILIDRINRLNNLKMLIASSQGGEVDAQKLDQIFEELDTASTETTPAPTPAAPVVPEPEPVLSEAALSLDAAGDSAGDLAAELDTLFVAETMPAMESSEVQYPDEVLPLDAIHPVDDELADDFIESHLSSKRGLTPALSDADETAGFDADAEPLDLPTQNDLADQLDFLFADSNSEGKSTITPSTLDSEELPPSLEDEEGPLAALTEDEGESPAGDSVVAALSAAEVPADADEPGRAPGGGIEETDFGSLEIQSKLDSFFAAADEEQGEAPAAASEAEANLDQTIAALDDVAILADDDQGDQSLSKTKEEEDFGSLEIQSKLDSFFAGADEVQGETLAAAPEAEADSDQTIA